MLEKGLSNNKSHAQSMRRSSFVSGLVSSALSFCKNIKDHTFCVLIIIYKGYGKIQFSGKDNRYGSALIFSTTPVIFWAQWI
jgi:hypothetical protein